MSEPIFHVATRADWEAARRSGTYTTSTLGRTLDEEGFIHACRREQVSSVFARYYADAGEPLVLLVIDPDRLTAPVRTEQVGDETYPHVYGPVPRRAVVSTVPLRPDGSSQSMLMLFVREATGRMFLAVLVMAAAVLGAAAGLQTGPDWAGLVGLLVGALLGAAGVAVVLRR